MQTQAKTTVAKGFPEPLWHVQLAVLFALVLQLLLPVDFVAGPRYILPVLEVLLLTSLILTTP